MSEQSLFRRKTKYGLWDSRVTLSFRSLQVSASSSKGKGAVKKHKKEKGHVYYLKKDKM